MRGERQSTETLSFRCWRERCRLTRGAAFTLAEGASHGAVSDSHSKAAFTLAEVLITLGIIGVVAAMTLPALIQKHQKQVTVTSLRKFYSILAQAKQLSEAQNGEMTYWQFPNTQTLADVEPFFDKYYRPYMSVINQCKSKQDCLSTYVSSRPVYTLKDGMQFMFDPNAQTSDCTRNYIYIVVDINGNKAPNKPGRDIFYMDIFPKRGAVMLGQMSEMDSSFNLGREELKNGVSINEGRDTACCSEECATPSFKYYTCGALIQADGWEIKDDYPW